MPDPLITVVWLTVARIVIGLGMVVILIGSLYKFKRAIVSVMGLMLLTNLICLFLILGLLTK